jgi:hypothetical protein
MLKGISSVKAHSLRRFYFLDSSAEIRLSPSNSSSSFLLLFAVFVDGNPLDQPPNQSVVSEHCSGRVKKAIPGSDRMGHYGSGKKGQSEEKGHYYGS